MSRYRKYGTSNKFSEEHRLHLPGNCYMTDIDGLYVDIKTNKLKVILEDKHKFENESFYNPIKSDSWQRKSLLNFCIKTNTYLVLNEISSDSWYYVNYDNIIANKIDTNIYLSNPNIKLQLEKYKFYKTENKLYIEIRNNNIVAIMYLKDEIESSVIEQFSKYYDTFEIDIQGDKIQITNDKKKSYTINSPDDWKIVYDKLHIK